MMKITIDGIDCYGEMYPEQNINVICELEMYDEIYLDGFDSWKDAVEELTCIYPDIVELEAV